MWTETVSANSIDLQFNVEEGEKFYVDRINIFGNTDYYLKM
jgi:outer membrane protein assembly factor BamA